MRKYLTLAAILGAIAFVSVSYLAQADSHTAAPAETAAPASTEAAPAAPVDVKAALEKDTTECKALASASSTEGAAPTAEAQDASFKKCMTDRGHAEEAAPAPAAEAPAPEAPATK